jgi:hypothetical protein
MFPGSVPKPNIKINFGGVYATNIKNSKIFGSVRKPNMKVVISGSVCVVNENSYTTYA